jgi:hypothetical protein
VSPFDVSFVPRGIIRKGLWRIRSSSKLPLAPWPFFIKVPPPKFRHGMSSSGYFTSLTHRFGFTQSSIDGAVVGRAVFCLGCRYQYWSRRWPGGQETGKLGCGTGDSPCDMLGSSHFVGVGCLESSWLANWLARAQAATSITTTARLARQARPYRAQCGRDRSVTFRSRSLKGDQSWPMDRAARLPSAARSRPIRHA